MRCNPPRPPHPSDLGTLALGHPISGTQWPTREMRKARLYLDSCRLLSSDDGVRSLMARCVLPTSATAVPWKCRASLLLLPHRGDNIRRQPLHDAFGEYEMLLALLLLSPRCTIAWKGHRTARGCIEAPKPGGRFGGETKTATKKTGSEERDPKRESGKERSKLRPQMDRKARCSKREKRASMGGGRDTPTILRPTIFRYSVVFYPGRWTRRRCSLGNPRETKLGLATHAKQNYG